ncbi:MAG: ATP synthase F1 subunit gamma [Candidatus Omnitrophica bacterium]|nr:ATP synthase F1 subunit gamma [Candidatus Omnitrophota bacterium]
MATLRQIRRRIRSVENTKQITRAMRMVAGAKLKIFEKALSTYQVYQSSLEGIVARLLSGAEPGEHPFLLKSEEIRRRLYLVFTSDTGLCGAYNLNLIKHVQELIHEDPGVISVFALVGKKGVSICRRRPLGEIRAQWTDLRGQINEEVLSGLADLAVELFSKGEVQEVFAAHTHFKSASRYAPAVKQLLPIDPERLVAETVGASGDAAKQSDGAQLHYLVEPDRESVVKSLLPQYLRALLRLVLLESFASEQAARVSAMRQATDNATEVLDALVLQRNKARQANITRELIEVISGAESLS